MEYPLDLDDLERYYHLLAETCLRLPASTVDKLVRTDYPMTTFQLNNVRLGRNHSLPGLIALIECNLLDFEINDRLRPGARLPGPIFQMPSMFRNTKTEEPATPE